MDAQSIAGVEIMIRRENWLMTESYLAELRESASNKSLDTISRYEFSLRPLLIWADDLSFENAFSTNNQSFSSYVANLHARRGDGFLAAESQKKIIIVSKIFLEWAIAKRLVNSKKMGEDSLRKMVYPKVQSSGADPISVSFDEIKKIAAYDFGNNLALTRDQAAMCFAYLSGARADSIVSASIKTIDLEKMEFKQLKEMGVRTKNSKSAVTFLLPIPDLLNVVKRWDAIVRSSLPETALWYAPLDSKWGDYSFSVNEAGKNRAGALAGQFKSIYEKIGMTDQSKSPHKFRHGFAVYALSKCKNMADYQAVSRNLMHSNLAITDSIYAVMEREERRKVIAGFAPSYLPAVEDDLEKLLSAINPQDRARAIQILAGKLYEV